MGQVGKNAKFMFIEHTGNHGGIARKEQESVRRHIANEAFRKRCARDDASSPELGGTIALLKISSEDCNTDRETIEKTDRDKVEESKPPLDRLSVVSLPIGTSDDTELMDHIAKRLWPGFRYRFEGSVNPFPAYWLPRSLDNPALYYALAFSALCHLSSRLSLAGQRPRNKGELVSLETRALVATREQISFPTMTEATNALEDLIMITICLATNVQGESLMTTRDPSPFYPILTSGRWLDTYGALAGRNIHWNAVQKLIEKRGGIESITSFGLPWVITCAALNVASATLSSPPYPLLDVEGRPYQMKKYKELVHLKSWEPPYPAMGEGFEFLRNVGLPAELVDVLIAVGDFSMVLNAYSTGQMIEIDMDAVLDTRDVLMHTLLSLPLEDNVAPMQSRVVHFTPPPQISSKEAVIRLRIYQACRWAALLFGILVVFPIPCSKFAREHAVSELRQLLSWFPAPSTKQDFSRLEVWLVVMGGSSSYDKEQRAWFRLRLSQVLSSLKIQAWHETRQVLMNFAWVPNTCDPAALTFWSEDIM